VRWFVFPPGNKQSSGSLVGVELMHATGKLILLHFARLAEIPASHAE
jgi:hypothetical protein